MTLLFNQYLSNQKSLFVKNSRTESTIFSFSLKLLSGHFMGNPSLRMSEVLPMCCCNNLGGNCIQNFIWGGISSDIRSEI